MKKTRTPKKEKKHDSNIKRLYRSREDKMIAGVCGGLGEYFNIDPVWIRLIAVLLIFVQGIGIILYLIGWLLIPENPTQKIKKETRAEEAVKEFKDATRKRNRRDGHVIIGIILVGLGGFFLFERYLTWLDFSHFWPLILIAIGLFIIMKRRRK